MAFDFTESVREMVVDIQAINVPSREQLRHTPFPVHMQRQGPDPRLQTPNPLSPGQGSLCHGVCRLPAAGSSALSTWIVWETPAQLIASGRKAPIKVSPDCGVESSAGLPGLLGTAWRDQPRPSSVQTADLALTLCAVTRLHREALTVSSPS